MSHPSLNRWGLNLFWYNYWFTDKKPSLVFHQDFLIIKLIHTYVNYGLFFKNNIFFSPFWIGSQEPNLKEKKEKVLEAATPSFRLMQYKNKVTQEINFVKLRIKKKNFHSSKIWILKYQGWVIINLYFLQPLKKKTNKIIQKSNKTVAGFAAITDGKKKQSTLFLLRLFFFLTYLNKLTCNNTSYYYF